MVDRSLNYGREHIARFAAEVDVRVALDLGPGRGDDMAAVKLAHPAARVVGIEPYPRYANALREHGFDIHELNVERDQLPFADVTVDLIVANQLFEHIKEIHWLLHECTRVLRVGGSLIIGVPNLASLHNRVLLSLGRQPTSISNWSAHVRGFTKPDLIATIGRGFPGGYRLRESAGANFYPFPGRLARPLAKLWPGGAWGMFCRFEKVRAYEDGYIRWPVDQALETNFYLGRTSTTS